LLEQKTEEKVWSRREYPWLSSFALLTGTRDRTLPEIKRGNGFSQEEAGGEEKG